jgi:hypothetical protein
MCSRFRDHVEFTELNQHGKKQTNGLGSIHQYIIILWQQKLVKSSYFLTILNSKRYASLYICYLNISLL